MPTVRIPRLGNTPRPTSRAYRPVLEQVTQGLTTTKGHPFYLVNNVDGTSRPAPEGHEDLAMPWVGAGDLKVGDKVRQADGTTGTVTQVRTAVEVRRMYNLDVATVDTFYVGQGQWLVHNAEFCNSGYLWFGSSERLRMIWQDPRMFENWLKNTQSLSRVNNPLSHDEAAAVLEAALNMGMKIDLNPAGLAGLEKNATWGQMPHFKVGSIHIPVQPGFKWP